MTHKIRSFAEDTYHEVPEPTVAQRAEAVLRADGRTEWESRRLHGLMYGDPIEQDGYDKLYGSASEADLALMALIALGTRDSEQIEQVARTSGRYRNKWDKHNSYLARTIARALDDSWAKYTKRHAAPPPEDEATRAAVTLTLAEYLKDPDALKPPVPTIPRLAWPGHITLFASPEGWGKSTHTRAGCAAVTTGQRFLDGEPVPPGNILWALLEEPVATCMIGAHRFGMDGNRFVTWRHPGADPVAELVDAILTRRPAVTVIDSIQELAIMAGVENLDDAVQVGGVLMSVVHACRDTGTAMIWLSQASKATGKYRNSSWFGHQCDVSLDIAEPAEGSGLRKITVRKTRIEGLRSYKVELVGNGYQLVLGDAVAQEQQAALQALADLGPGAHKIAALALKLGWDKRRVERHLKPLAGREVTRRKHGQAWTYRLTTPGHHTTATPIGVWRGGAVDAKTEPPSHDAVMRGGAVEPQDNLPF